MELIKKGCLICVAGLCIGIGVGIILYANIGGDTVTVFQDGLHIILNISYGQSSRIYNGVLIIAALVAARKYFGGGTILSALITGYVIDFAYDGLSGLNLQLSFISMFIVFLIGQTVYTIGLSILIRCKLGMNGLDSLLYRLVDLIKIDYRWLRLGADLLLTIIGFLLGGVVGIGTAISIASTGIMIDFFTKIGGRNEESIKNVS